MNKSCKWSYLLINLHFKTLIKDLAKTQLNVSIGTYTAKQLEISQEKIKYKRISKRKKTFSSNYKKNLSNLTESIFPLPWMIWPYEAKTLIVLIGIWSILGICILGSSSWWVASREMGNWAYFLKTNHLDNSRNWSILFRT